MNDSLKLCYETLHSIDTSNENLNEKITKNIIEIQLLKDILYEKYTVNSKLRKKLRKLLKLLNILPILPNSCMKSDENNENQIIIELKRENKRIFNWNYENTIENECIYRLNNNKLVIFMPLIECEGYFECEFGNIMNNIGKYSETHIEVIESGLSYQVIILETLFMHENCCFCYILTEILFLYFILTFHA